MALTIPEAEQVQAVLTARIHDLIGTEYRDAAEAAAVRAEAAADTAVTGVEDGSVTRLKLGPDVVAELEGKADTDYVDGRLASSTRSGISLLPMVPGTNTPMWAASFREVTDDVPPGEKVAYANNEDGSGIAMEWQDGWVKVSPRHRYRVRIWLKADTPGSDIVLFSYGDTDSRGIEGNTLGFSHNYPAWVRNIPTEWTLYEGTFRIRDGVTALRIGSVTWNHSGGDNTGAVQYVSGFEIWPDFATHSEVVEQLEGKADRQVMNDVLENKSDVGHTHATGDITDLLEQTALPTANTLAARDVAGRLNAVDPIHPTHLTTKNYVDSEVGKKADKAHTHAVSDTPGLRGELDSKADADHTHTFTDLTGVPDFATKDYVDSLAPQKYLITDTTTTSGTYDAWVGDWPGEIVAENITLPPGRWKMTLTSYVSSSGYIRVYGVDQILAPTDTAYISIYNPASSTSVVAGTLSGEVAEPVTFYVHLYGARSPYATSIVLESF